MEEGHHQAEQSHGLGQGETKNGVREQPLLQRWVSGISDDERSKHRSNTSSRSSNSDGGSSGSDELGGGVNVLLGSGGVDEGGGGGSGGVPPGGHGEAGGDGETSDGRHCGDEVVFTVSGRSDSSFFC